MSNINDSILHFKAANIQVINNNNSSDLFPPNPLALSFFSLSFFHTISLSPAFISARWAD
jgi:hypothetical protein